LVKLKAPALSGSMHYRAREECKIYFYFLPLPNLTLPGCN
jgi:hypothetical protein